MPLLQFSKGFKNTKMLQRFKKYVLFSKLPQYLVTYIVTRKTRISGFDLFQKYTQNENPKRKIHRKLG